MKNNKKFLSLIIIFILIETSIVASNYATLYGRDDFEVQAINTLALRSSTNGIFDSYPATKTSLQDAINRVDITKLDNYELKLYNKVLTMLDEKSNLYNDEDSSVNGDILFSGAMRSYRTNSESLKQYELLEQYKDNLPWIDTRMQIDFGDYFYGYTQFEFQDENFYDYDEDVPSFDHSLHSSPFNDDSAYKLNSMEPLKIGLSAGSGNFNFQFGRNRLSEGSGITGNLIIGDNYSRQDYISYSLFSGFFSYHMSLTQFDLQQPDGSMYPVSFNNDSQYRVINRFTVTPLDNLSFDFYQGALFKTQYVDYRMILPFMYVHNYFNFDQDSSTDSYNDEANNILGANLKWVIMRGLEVNLQTVLDQYTLPTENYGGFPNAYGILFNIKNSISMKNGSLNNYIEVVYTSPYLYLNEKKESNGDENYNYDWILGNYLTGSVDEISYSGYIYGPDNLVLAYGFNYLSYNEWSAGTDFIFRMDGTKGIQTDRNSSVSIGEVDNTLFMVGTPEISFTIRPTVSFDINNVIFFNGVFGFVGKINRFHDITSSVSYNIQGAISATIKLL
jgi:hypothetical protein